jgi:hypothetical protein
MLSKMASCHFDVKSRTEVGEVDLVWSLPVDLELPAC